MTAAEFVNCRLDSTYQAANPELMVSHRFVVVDGGATPEPVRAGSAYQAANPELMVTHRFVVVASAPAEPVDIEFLRRDNPNYYHPGRQEARPRITSTLKGPASDRSLF